MPNSMNLVPSKNIDRCLYLPAVQMKVACTAKKAGHES